jgi:hypothetical protein
MKPKPIWKPFLNTGIRFFLCSILLLISCSPGQVHDDLYTVEYVLKNQTSLQLKISAIYFFSFEDRTPEYISGYKIESKDSLTQEVVGIGGILSFQKFIVADSVVVTFGNKKSISFTPRDRSKYNILNLPNYSKDSISEFRCSYTYTFTEADYNNATPPCLWRRLHRLCMALYRSRGLTRRFGVYRISNYFRDSTAGLGKKGRRTEP